MNRLLKIIAILLLLFFVTLSSVYLFAINRWKIAFTESEMIFLANKVNNSSSLPEMFYEVYDKMYPNQRFSSMNDELFFVIKQLYSNSNYSISCECRSSYYNLSSSEKNYKKGFEYIGCFAGWGLEKYSSPEKCFDYNLNSFISSFNSQDGFPALSKLLETPLEEMNENQIIELFILWNGVASFDKIYYPERFANEFEKWKNKVNESN